MAPDNDRRVGDLVKLVRGTSYKGQLVGEPGPALLGLGSIIPGGGFREGEYKTYGGDCPEKLMLYPGDLYVSLKGATKDDDMIGSIARVPSQVASGRLTQDTVKLVLNADAQDLRSYLYWLLRTPQYRLYCAGHATGSAVVALSREDFLAYPVPPLTAARKLIVESLERFEEKIGLNRRTNETLEAMARAIFKDWFVDFGPTRAKAEGREPYLAREIWDLFPDALDDEDKPTGWRISEIGKEVNAVGGSTPSTKESAYWEGGEHYWATPKDLSRLSFPVLLDTDRKITDAGVKKISSGILPIGTVLLSSRAPIGYLAIAEIPVSVNQGFIALVCEKRLPNVFVLFWCHENLDYIKGISGGSTFAEISKKTFRPIPVIVPSEQVLIAYERLVRPLYERIVANVRETSTLTQTRDLLLPKLMSGKIRLRDAEKAVEAVA